MWTPSRRATAPEPDWLDEAFEGAARGRRRGRRLLLLLTLLVLALGLGGSAAWLFWSQPSESAPEGAGDAPSADDPPAPHNPPKAQPGPARIPERGTGVFARAPGAGRKAGNGRLLRYVVEVEGGIGQRPNVFAHLVDTILAHRQGWTAGGKWAFQRVSSGSYDFAVKLAAPGTVDKICGRHGLDTGGRVNCAGGSDVVINLKRWLLLTPFYKGRPALYRALAINHEVGHRLGYGHMACPRKGSPAPVMQQQIYGLHGCAVNGWPYDSRGRFVSGPPTR